jgi:spore germination cell wall hydrolase CwlJ-like protein
MLGHLALRHRLTRRIRLLVVGVVIALAAIVVVLLQLGPTAPEQRTFRAATSPPAGAIPLEKLPARPETMSQRQMAPLSADEARKRNASVPFADLNPVPARPFRFQGSELDLARATDCLAIAALAEAGGSDAGQRAVIQVVLNRVRHPAFAKTICAAVFQGSQRLTGCQFSFTCDGALKRRYSDDAWTAARQRAREAIAGRVYAPVGLATHYHTDWVYPYWSSELEKIARIDTHLFFRWPGFWGTPQALVAIYRGNETAIGALSTLPSHTQRTLAAAGAAPTEEAEGTSQASATLSTVGEVVVRHPEGRAFFVHLNGTASAAAALSLAQELCRAQQRSCRAMGWLERAAVPDDYPVPRAARAKLSFSYVRESGKEIVFYDCKHFATVPQEQCIPLARQAS